MQQKCGPACLYVALAARDVPVGDFESFTSGFGEQNQIGYNLAQLKKRCEDFGVHAECVHLDGSSLRNLPPVAGIAHLKSGHFVVVVAANAAEVMLIDPPESRRVNLDDFLADWSGKMLVINPVKSYFWQLFVCLAIALIIVTGILFGFFLRRAHLSPSFGRINGHRLGMTLIEVVVVLGILALLLGLTATGVQSARESARGLTCSNHLRQLGLAIQNYNSAFRSFPSGALTPQLVSPYFAFSHYLEDADESYERFSYAPYTAVDVFGRQAPPLLRCPSDPVEGSNYRFCVGDTSYADPRYPSFLRSARGVFVWPSKVSISSVRDGLTNTAIASERRKSQSPSNHVDHIQFADLTPTNNPRTMPTTEQINSSCQPRLLRSYYKTPGRDWVGSGLLMAWYNHVRTPNLGQDCTIENVPMNILPFGGIVSASSHHAGGVYLAFADAHIQFASNGIELVAWQAIGSRDSGEIEYFEE